MRLNRARVILADDHRMFAEGLKHLLEPEYDVVAMVEDGQALVDAVARLSPDLVISDITMPKLSGIEAARRIKEATPEVKFIMLTMHEDATYAATAIEEGADGYILKHAEPTELQLAVRAVLDGGTYVAASMADSAFKRLGSHRSEKATKLTSRQRDVLQMLASGKTAKEVASALNLTQKTVEYHKYRIMGLLGIESSAELVKYAVEKKFV